MPINRIACVTHTLCDERFFTCIFPLTVGTEAAGRPAELDHLKAIRITKIDAVYTDIRQSYQMWLSDYINLFGDGLFKKDLAVIQPPLAVFKEGDAI
jgi:hypothetical protein